MDRHPDDQSFDSPFRTPRARKARRMRRMVAGAGVLALAVSGLVAVTQGATRDA